MKRAIQTALSAVLVLGPACEEEQDPCDCVSAGDFNIVTHCGNPVVINASAGPEQVTEALTALRDQKPVVVDFVKSSADGFSGTAGYAYSTGDGTVFFTSFGYVDSYAIGLPIDRYELKEPAFFAACLADADPNARFECLYTMTAAKLGTCGG